jgi:hypothetical protein
LFASLEYYGKNSQGFGFMKLQTDITINGKYYKKGDSISGWAMYPFFLIHMLMFGGSGFLMAYADNAAPVGFLYAHGGFAIFIYCIFYLTLFGKEQVKWMFINAALGIFGIYAEIDLILGVFGKQASEFPFYVHAIPFLYYVLYTFLLRQVVLDLCKARGNDEKEGKVNFWYIIISLVVYGLIFFLT